jgi:hypothetical protein
MQTGSPATLSGIDPGLRTVRLDLGAFGSVERRVSITEGHTTDLCFEATGSIEVDATVPRPEARAWVVGRKPQSVPCRFDSLPVGTLNVFYEDSQVPLWQREVVIRAETTHRVRVPNAIAAGQSLLRIESWHIRPGHGLTEAVGDSIFVDQEFVGLTPWEEEITPGIHGIRLSRDDQQVWTEVVELAAGSSRVIAPRFGLTEWPQFHHVAPGRVVVRGPLLLTVTIDSPRPEDVREPRLHFHGLESGQRDLPLSAVDAHAGVYVGMLAPGSIPMGRELLYYFTVENPSLDTISSELYSLTAVSEISQLLEP